MSDQEKERRAQAWLAFASAATAGLTGAVEPPEADNDGDIDEEELETYSDLVSDCAVAVADKMLSEFEERFKTKAVRKTRSRKTNDDEGEDD
jgi:hypothetical protein